MVFKQTVLAGSDIVTENVWNNVQYNIGSEFEVSYGFQTGSDYYEYDVSGNLISGNHYSVTGSYYDWWDYSGANLLVSGHVLRDGRQVDFTYYYDANNNLSGIQSRVVV